MQTNTTSWHPALSEAASAIFEVLLEQAEPQTELSTEPVSNEVRLLCGLVGDADGMLSISLSQAAAFRIVYLLGGFIPRSLDAFARSCLREFAQMVGGNVAYQLATQGAQIQVVPCSVLSGTDAASVFTIYSQPSETLSVPGVGEIKIELSLNRFQTRHVA
jgi:CheY-specific phosphatase CheX